MIAQFPDLEETLANANAMYDDLFEREGLDYHLAYIADLEATFTPLFKMIFDHRASFFAGGDDRVGTLFLWHFAEEIEHRSSALIVQRHITPDPGTASASCGTCSPTSPRCSTACSPGSSNTCRLRPPGSRSPGFATVPASSATR